MVRPGEVRRGIARSGRARRLWLGGAWRGLVGRGPTRQLGRAKARQGGDRPGWVRQLRPGVAGRGEARRGNARLGIAMPGNEQGESNEHKPRRSSIGNTDERNR